MKLWVKALISFGVLGVVFAVIPWSELRDAVSGGSWTVWGLVLVGFLAGHLLGAHKWRLLVSAAGAKLAWLAAVRYYAAGLFANLCLPTIVGGDLLRAAMAGRATKKVEVVVVASVADRLIDVASMVVFILVAGILLGDTASAAPSRILVVAVVGGGILGLIALPFVLRRPLRRWPRKLRRTVGKLVVALREMRRHPGATAAAILMSLIIQGGFVLLNAWLGWSIGIGVPVATWFLVWPLAKLSGLLPVSLGGLGVRDATLAGLLVPFGVPAAQGFVVSLLWQAVLIGGGLLSGALWALTRPATESPRLFAAADATSKERTT